MSDQERIETKSTCCNAMAKKDFIENTEAGPKYKLTCTKCGKTEEVVENNITE